MNPALPYIAFRLREHGCSAFCAGAAVVCWSSDYGFAVICDWKDCRNYLGYSF